MTERGSYDPETHQVMTFHDAVPAFLGGADTPRADLERCLQVIADKEPAIQAFVSTNLDGAREAAE